MDMRLGGKRALVTGASSGMGVEIAKLLAEEGVAVAVHGRDRPRTEATAGQITRAGGRAVVAVGDLTTDAGADAVAAAVNEALGGVDILVNNAGGPIGRDTPRWDDIPASQFLEAYNLNLVAALRMIRRLAPAMAERGWGRVINISSGTARQGVGIVHDYAAAKIALESLSLNLSLNLAPQGVTVNTVMPGSTLTEMGREYLEALRDERGWPDDLAEMERRFVTELSPQPIPRMGKPEEIASAVVFLASPRSDYTTSAVLRVDGGFSKAL